MSRRAGRRREHENSKVAGQPTAFTPFFDQISDHVKATIGPVSKVFHEIVSGSVHADLLVVPAQPNLKSSKARPLGGDYVTIVTSGVSSRPMNVPAKVLAGGVTRYAELMVAHPLVEANGAAAMEEIIAELSDHPLKSVKRGK